MEGKPLRFNIKNIQNGLGYKQREKIKRGVIEGTGTTYKKGKGKHLKVNRGLEVTGKQYDGKFRITRKLQGQR